MITRKNNRLIRIGVFYDGNYLIHVSNYYQYSHTRKSRISIAGLHKFIRKQVAGLESVEERFCKIVDAHYFRGRLNANDALHQDDFILNERKFEDILGDEWVTTHFLPVRYYKGANHEKGIDVWLAAETLQLASSGKFDVIVLVTSDGDYASLIRKLKLLGMPVVLLSWDFEYITDTGKKTGNRTSQKLLEEATYPIAMHQLIDNRLIKNEPLIAQLFMPWVDETPKPVNPKPLPSSSGEAVDNIGTILLLNGNYGFIKHPNYYNNLYFHKLSTISDFSKLKPEDEVYFEIGTNRQGEAIAQKVSLKM